MTVELTPEQQRVIELAVRSGACESPADAIDQAFEMLRVQLGLQDWMTAQREAIVAHIEKGLAEADRGEVMNADEALEMLRRGRAQRPKRQG
ncbi:MAG TPA: hypothetical protein VLW54_09520 [Candidatus Acidoferrales bacterium]|nr:hypothetical protein [Candidatus Acidoferrales bacterium]